MVGKDTRDGEGSEVKSERNVVSQVAVLGLMFEDDLMIPRG